MSASCIAAGVVMLVLWGLFYWLSLQSWRRIAAREYRRGIDDGFERALQEVERRWGQGARQGRRLRRLVAKIASKN